MNRAVGLVILTTTILFFHSTLHAQDAQEMLENIKSKYDSINDAEFKFSQRTKFALSKKEQTIRGTLAIKKGNKYRVETGVTTIVTDGITVWSYSSATKQVLIDHFKENKRSLTPEKILAAAPKDYTPSYVGSEKTGKVKTQVLKLVPKSEDSMVGTMKLWVEESTWLIKKAEIVDDNGKETLYTVNESRINIALPDSRFTFQIPGGAEVVDLR